MNGCTLQSLLSQNDKITVFQVWAHGILNTAQHVFKFSLSSNPPCFDILFIEKILISVMLEFRVCFLPCSCCCSIIIKDRLKLLRELNWKSNVLRHKLCTRSKQSPVNSRILLLLQIMSLISESSGYGKTGSLCISARFASFLNINSITFLFWLLFYWVCWGVKKHHPSIYLSYGEGAIAGTLERHIEAQFNKSTKSRLGIG